MDMRHTRQASRPLVEIIDFDELAQQAMRFDGPIMLTYDKTAHKSLLDRVQTALQGRELICVGSDFETVKPDENLLREACLTARDKQIGLVLALETTNSIMLANAIAACSWCDADPVAKFYFNVGTSKRANIPVGHIFLMGEDGSVGNRSKPIFGPHVTPEFIVHVN